MNTPTRALGMPKIFILIEIDIYPIMRFFVRSHAVIISSPPVFFFSTKFFGYVKLDEFTQNLEQIHLTQGQYPESQRESYLVFNPKLISTTLNSICCIWPDK